MGKKKGKKDADPVEPEHNSAWERVRSQVTELMRAAWALLAVDSSGV